MTVFKLTKLPCGCKIKEYTGGMIVISSEFCHENHVSRNYWKCPVNSCRLELPSKKSMKKHRWIHAQ